MHHLGLVPANHTGLPQYCSPAKARSLSGAGARRGSGAPGKGVHKHPPPTHHLSIRKLSRSSYFRFESVDISSPLGRCVDGGYVALRLPPCYGVMEELSHATRILFLSNKNVL